MYTLGISAYYHDSAAALIKDGKIIAAAQEERFSRKKHDSGFPKLSVNYCLDEAGIKLNDLEQIVFYDKPFLKFERLLETYYNFAPKGFASFLMAMPTWLKEKLFLKKIIKNELEELGFRFSCPILFSEHHLSHAASAFYASPFCEAAILTLDGVGEWATTSIGLGNNSNIKFLKEIHFPHSLGLLYSAFTYYLGFKVNSGEYKLMGLAPYGNKDDEQTKNFIEIIKSKIVAINEDGSFFLNQSNFSFQVGLKMVPDKKWEKLFGIPKRNPESEITQAHCNLAIAIQMVTEEIVLQLAKTAKSLTGSNSLCLAGGVALNCVANGKLLKEKIFDNIWIQPAAGDAGGALGAAYTGYYIYAGQKRETYKDEMDGSYWGPKYTAQEIKKLIEKKSAKFTYFNSEKDLCEKTAKHLADGKVVGWFQGRMEWGPRALGNRSILGDPRNPEMQKRLNLKIKYRESFRPFAPSIKEEKISEFFDIESDSPYMLLVSNVTKSRQIEKPINYDQLPLMEKLYCTRSDLPAITHLDYSARVQTVSKNTNSRYWNLLDSFQTKTGCPVLVNTSFNVRGEPIVCSPEDAYNCFMNTEMDYLVLNDFIIEK